MTAKRWPATLAEFEELEAKALAKYTPLVDALGPAELVALASAVERALASMAVRPAAYAPTTAGTRVGR